MRTVSFLQGDKEIEMKLPKSNHFYVKSLSKLFSYYCTDNVRSVILFTGVGGGGGSVHLGPDSPLPGPLPTDPLPQDHKLLTHTPDHDLLTHTPRPVDL